MAERIVRNGVELVTRESLINAMQMNMEEMDSVLDALQIMRKIAERDVRDLMLVGLADAAIAALAAIHNDLDVVREQAEKCGLVTA
ncbi:hypothetical protein AZOA_04470 [Azoarcus sp. Aa7]|nr:hypothetical protein [Azoarcus sp. Aa7]